MKKCKNCNLLINNDYDNCLFCDSKLVEVENRNYKIQLFPKYVKEKNILKLLKRSFTFVILSLLIILSLLNLFYFKNSQLQYILISSSMYLLLMTFMVLDMSKSWLFKVSWSVILTTLLTITIGYLSNNYDWSLNYVLPFAFLGNALFSTIVLMVKNKNWHSYVIYLLITLVLGIIPLPLVLFKVVKVTWPAIVCSLYCLLTILGLWLFAPKNMKEELFRRFHV